MISTRRGRPPYKRKVDPNIRGCKPKEMAAIDAYMRNGFVKKDALREAGYTGNGTDLFDRKFIWDEIQRRIMKIEVDRQKAYSRAKIKNNISKERLINEYAKIAFAPLSRGRMVTVDDETGEQTELIEITQEQRDIGADIPVDARDKKNALDSLAKLEGLFVDRLLVSDEREVVAALLAGRKRIAKELPENVEDPEDGGLREDMSVL